MNILIVDDDIVDRKLVKNALCTATEFHNITEASSVSEGLKASEIGDFDIILLDCNMPKVHGIEMLIEMRAKPNLGNTAIIMMSTSEDSPLALECIEAGAQDFLSKSDISLRNLNKAILYAKKRFETEQHSHENYLVVKQLAEQDALTKLSNRYHFEEVATTMMDCKTEHCPEMALLALDIDNFKHINDTLGHDIGDGVLKEFVSRVNSVLSEDEFFARLGGDEFAVMMKKTKHHDEITQLSGCVFEQLKEPFFINGKTIHCRVSIGSARFPTDATHFHDLLKCADIAMYRSKQSGKNKASCYETFYQEEFNRSFNIENGIKAVMDQNAFRLFYQPVYATKTQSIVGFEALIRWPQGEVMYTPDEFIPIAEESGLISDLGPWIISTAIQQLSVWYERYDFPLTMAINISPIQLQDESLLTHLIRTVDKYGIAANMITLEVTETVLFKNNDKVTEMLTRLSEYGFQIALDDFGTGYSSISHLIDCPIDIVKFDKSMQSSVCEGNKRYKVMEGLAIMLNKLGLTIIAEGIETQEQSNVCKQLNLGYQQGYLLSRPLPANDIDLLLGDIPAPMSYTTPSLYSIYSN